MPRARGPGSPTPLPGLVLCRLCPAATQEDLSLRSGGRSSELTERGGRSPGNLWFLAGRSDAHDSPDLRRASEAGRSPQPVDPDATSGWVVWTELSCRTDSGWCPSIARWWCGTPPPPSRQHTDVGLGDRNPKRGVERAGQADNRTGTASCVPGVPLRRCVQGTWDPTGHCPVRTAPSPLCRGGDRGPASGWQTPPPVCSQPHGSLPTCLVEQVLFHFHKVQ